MNWNYICVLVDLFYREIIGYSAGRNKTANLVKQAFQFVEGNVKDIQIFHTDRGNEFKNLTIHLLQTIAVSLKRQSAVFLRKPQKTYLGFLIKTRSMKSLLGSAPRRLP